MIRVLVNGARGKMGRVACAALQAADDLQLVGETGHEDDLAQAIVKYQPTVVVDFTTPQAVYKNAQIIVAAKVHPVIGTTGLTQDQINVLTLQCELQQLGAIIAPNFSIAAILMMRHAQQIARYLPDAEIIELHHNQKKDAPSGTAIKTAQMMKESTHRDVPIHSVRLPGLFAHEEIIFGGLGETLTIRYDGLDRQCCMPGLLMACRHVVTLKNLMYGLDSLLT